LLAEPAGAKIREFPKLLLANGKKRGHIWGNCAHHSFLVELR
jgi:hypothetical protein